MTRKRPPMKRFFTTLAFCVLLPAAAFAASFTATVDSDSAVVGQGMTLQLTLSGASAQSGPDTSVLEPSFDIVSQGQSSNTTIINGSVSSSIGWELTLLPRKAGTVTIPPVKIATSGGTLQSQPITLNVSAASAAPPAMTGRGASGGSAPAAVNGRVYIRAAAGQDDPYQNQPVSYTVRVLSKAAMTDIALQPPHADNAIIKSVQKPTIGTTVENGMRFNAVTFHFLVTPIGTGKISIPPALLQGNVEVQSQAAPQGFGNVFTDPFRMLQNMNGFANFGFDSYKPFSVASNAVTLNVRPPVAGMQPWLPLSSLRISQHFDMTPPVHVGDPVTRRIVLLADGMTGSQLPDLKGLQNSADFSLYAGKPETGDHINGKTGVVSGWRRESYSLIPQKAGKLVVPALKIRWWNTVEGKAEVSTLPEKVIAVLPAAGPSAAQGAGQSGRSSGGSGDQTAAAPAPLKIASVNGAAQSGSVNNVSGPRWLYGLIAVIALILFFALFWALSLQRKINRLVAVKEPAAEKKPKPAAQKEPSGFAGVDKAQTAEDLKNYLQGYARAHWGAQGNMPLEKIFAAAREKRPALGGAEAQALLRDLTGAIYAGKTAHIGDLKKRCKAVLQAAKETAADGGASAGGEKLSGLNPS